MPIPVYVFTGFLDAGKTKFIQETLEDPGSTPGERTLLLAFEEGEEEYDLSAFPKKNVSGGSGSGHGDHAAAGGAAKSTGPSGWWRSLTA